MAKRGSISKDSEAYHALKGLLLSKRFAPGQHIVYRELEDMLKMSKTPIIGALGKLEQENLVVLNRNRGYYMKRLSETEVKQVFELKEKLQEICVDYAVDRYKQSDLVVLRKTLKNYLSYSGDFYDLKRFELDKQFHTQIARMGGNDFLTSVINQLYELVCIGLNLISLTPLVASFKNDHQLIFKYIEARDAARAKSVLRKHDRSGGRMLVEATKSFARSDFMAE